jgi:hypothetical protein
MTTKKTAKENQTPNTSAVVTNDCPRISQAYGAIRALERDGDEEAGCAEESTGYTME